MPGNGKISRRRFTKAALVTVSAAVGAAAGFIQLKKFWERPSAPTTATTTAATSAATTRPPIPSSVELVLLNGKIITVDSKDSVAEAVAVGAGKIIKVGTSEEIRKLIGQSTNVIDLKGKTVTPGLIDAHSHIEAGGYVEKYLLDLRPGKVGSIADIVRLVAKKADETPKGEWIQGSGWHPDWLSEKRPPTRSDIDPVTPNHPVFLIDLGGWNGVVNSYALRLAGIDEKTPDPQGGIIDRDKRTNSPTGLLINHSAMWLVHRPPPSDEQLEEGIKYASNLFLAEGVTSIQDNWVRGSDNLQAYGRLGSRGEPPARVDPYFLIITEAEAERSVSVRPFKSAMVNFNGWKLQVDGSFATAFTYEPHNGRINTLPAMKPETLNRIVSILHKSGLQISIHVGGDKALDVALDAIEAALKENPRPNHRHRLEHVIVSPRKGALERIKRLGVVISVQPSFIYHTGDLLLRGFGAERMQMSIPVKTPMNMGIPVAFGADYPCTPDTRPQLTLWSAVTRQTSTGAVLGPQERVTIRDALRLHTIGSAYAAHEEDVKGSIEEGKQADLVVWSDDMYSVPTDKIKDLKAMLTIVGGRTVYKSS